MKQRFSQEDFKWAVTEYRHYPIKMTDEQKQQAEMVLHCKATVADVLDALDYVSKPLVINNNNVSRGMAKLTYIIKDALKLSDEEWQKLWDKADKALDKEEKEQLASLKKQMLGKDSKAHK